MPLAGAPTGRSRGAVISQYYNRTVKLRRRTSRPQLGHLGRSARPSLRLYDLELDSTALEEEGEYVGAEPGWGAGRAGQGEGWGAAHLRTPPLAGCLKALSCEVPLQEGECLGVSALEQRSGGSFRAVKGLAWQAGAQKRLLMHSTSIEYLQCCRRWPQLWKANPFWHLCSLLSAH